MKDNIENSVEDGNKKDNETTVPENGTQVQVPLTLADKLRKFFNFFTVEPFLLCYILPITISALAVQKLNTEKACRVDLNYTEEICRHVVDADESDNITVEAKLAAITMVSDMTAWQQPLQSSIPAILILFVGAWSDRTGNRKALMLIPVIGEIVSNFGMLWATYFFLEWPLWVTALIEAVPTALSGGFSIALMGAYSFLADVTTEESRTFRFGILSVIVTLGMPFGTSISGVLLDQVGYFGIFSISLAIYIIGFIHTCLRVHDVRKSNTEGTINKKEMMFFNPQHIMNLLSLFFKSPCKKVIKILLVLCAHIVIMGPVIGEASITYLYTLQRYNMTVVVYSLFNTFSILMGTIGTAVAVTIFSKYLKMHDSFLGMIATACKIVSSFVYGLAPTQAWFFAGPVFDFFGTSGTTAIRSIGTKIVAPDQVGKMCSLIGFAESLLPIMYTPIYAQVFTNTVETAPGAFFFVGGSMTVPAFFIFLTLYIQNKKEQTDIVQNPESKEMHAYDNAFEIKNEI